MVSEPLPKIDRFGNPHASVNYPEELDDNASLTIRSVGLVIHVVYLYDYSVSNFVASR